MKLRLGFVSNSSSSSFCIIGTTNKKVISLCLEKDNIDWTNLEDTDYGYGELKTKKLNYYGTYEDNLPYYVGLEAEKLLENKTLPEAIEYTLNYFKENYTDNIKKSDIEFCYDICSSD